jgi:hypothetical protein
MCSEGLLESWTKPGQQREVYYGYRQKLCARLCIGCLPMTGFWIAGDNRQYLEQEHRISLEGIAAKLLDQSFGLKKGQRLLITTENSICPWWKNCCWNWRRGIITSLIYQDMELLRPNTKIFPFCLSGRL